jgi:Holliday junction resolvase RusA-like endonuclease
MALSIARFPNERTHNPRHYFYRQFNYRLFYIRNRLVALQKHTEATMILLDCFIATEPVAKARPRITRQGHAYTPSKTKEAEHRIQMEVARLYKNKPYENAVRLIIDVYVEKPKSTPKKRMFPTVKPDWDNYAKLVCDALNGIVWRDDAQIISAVVTKSYVPANMVITRPGYEIKVFTDGDI